jgi:hypothetical protein
MNRTTTINNELIRSPGRFVVTPEFPKCVDSALLIVRNDNKNYLRHNVLPMRFPTRRLMRATVTMANESESGKGFVGVT